LPGEGVIICGRRRIAAMPEDDRRIEARTEDLFVWRSVTVEARPRALPLPFHELYRYLTDPSTSLGMDQQRLLFSDPRLRLDFQQLKRDLSALPGFQEMPRAAAAADDYELNERRFEGGKVRIVISERDARQTYVIFEFDNPDRSLAALVLEAQNGELAKLRLGPLLEKGVVQVMLDTRREEHDRIVRLLRDPQTVGVFL
jgi:hypothetical protein